MKNLRVPLFGVAIVLFLFSCKKNDMQAPVTQSTTTNTAKINVDSTQSLKSSSAWTALSNWQVANQQSFNLYYKSIPEAKITSAVASNGLVLVYKKSANNTIVRLPFEEKTGSQLSNYWYYQVSNGKVLISRDSYNNAQASSQDNFQYVIFTPDQLAKLEAKGYDRNKLMGISYEEVVKL
ncbi:MAG: hypothetical protein ACJ748_03830 [Flavisolibacter sp.]